jgi:hypothetical protein
MFWRLDSVSIFRQNLLNWAQLTELVPISEHLHQHKIYKGIQTKHNTNHLQGLKQTLKTFKKLNMYEA